MIKKISFQTIVGRSCRIGGIDAIEDGRRHVADDTTRNAANIEQCAADRPAVASNDSSDDDDNSTTVVGKNSRCSINN